MQAATPSNSNMTFYGTYGTGGMNQTLNKHAIFGSTKNVNKSQHFAQDTQHSKTTLPKIILKNNLNSKNDNHNEYRDVPEYFKSQSSEPEPDSNSEAPTMEKYKQKSSLNKVLHNMEQVVVFGSPNKFNSPKFDSVNQKSPKSIV